jgi:hypothetical protein
MIEVEYGDTGWYVVIAALPETGGSATVLSVSDA